MPKILVVDDVEENVYALTRTLKLQGYEVIAAGNGLEALDKVSKEHPDLVIMDIQMPVMDGHEACRRLKSNEETRHIPVIFLTAKYPELEDKVTGIEMGADGYLTKPFNLLELTSEVRSLLRIKGLYDELSDSRQRLKEYSERLEDMVVARTAELRTAQAKLVQSERLSAIGRLAAEIAHEINNPLAIINNYLRLISDDMSENDPHRDDVSILNEEVERIVKIVRDLLSFSKPPLRAEPVNMNDEAGKMLSFYKDTFSQKGIDVSAELYAADPIVRVDPDGMRQVMINIINNALEAMHNGGKLIISSFSDERSVRMSFRDTGDGISKEAMGRIFEPFFSTKGSKGTGLGLSICYGIIKGLKGDIEVESTVGKGTTFTITLTREA